MIASTRLTTAPTPSPGAGFGASAGDGAPIFGALLVGAGGDGAAMLASPPPPIAAPIPAQTPGQTPTAIKAAPLQDKAIDDTASPPIATMPRDPIMWRAPGQPVISPPIAAVADARAAIVAPRQADAADGTALPPIPAMPRDPIMWRTPGQPVISPPIAPEADARAAIVAPRLATVPWPTPTASAPTPLDPPSARGSDDDVPAVDDAVPDDTATLSIIALPAPIAFAPLPIDARPPNVATVRVALLTSGSIAPPIATFGAAPPAPITTPTRSDVEPATVEPDRGTSRAPMSALAPAPAPAPTMPPIDGLIASPSALAASPVDTPTAPPTPMPGPLTAVATAPSIVANVLPEARPVVASIVTDRVPDDHPAPIDAPTPLAVARQAAMPAPTLPQIVQGPAAQVFGAAIAAARRDDRSGDDRASDPATLQPMAEAGRTTVTTVAATTDAQQAPLDMNQQRWPHAMVDRIAHLRDAAAAVSASAADTRIRLVPDALGAIDVAITRDGDSVSVRFQAEQPATRTLLQDAQTKLADIAESRGLKLSGSSVDAGGTGTGQQQSPQQPQPVLPRAPRRAAADPSTPDPVTRDDAVTRVA